MSSEWQNSLWSFGSMIEMNIAIFAALISIKYFRNLKILRKEKLGGFLAWAYLIIGCAALHHLVMSLKFIHFIPYFSTGLIVLQLGVYANLFVMFQNLGRMPVDAHDKDHKTWLLINHRGEKINYAGPPEDALTVTDMLNAVWAGRDYFECVFGEKDQKHSLMLPSVRYPWLCDVIPGKKSISSLGDKLITLGMFLLVANIIYFFSL